MRLTIKLMTIHAPHLMHQGLPAIRRNAIAKPLRGVFGVEHPRGGQQEGIDHPDVVELAAVHQTATAAAYAVTFDRIYAALGAMVAGKIKIALKLLKDGRLLRQNRSLAFVPGKAEPSAARFDRLAEVCARKQQRDRATLPAPLPFEAGTRAKVPRFDAGVVQALAGDDVSTGFPDGSVPTFMAGFVEPA